MSRARRGRSPHGAGRCAALLLLVFATAVFAQDEQTIVDSGMANYRAGQYAQAVRDLRIARFLTLDRPRRHLEILARLALAEDGAKLAKARDNTLERFLQVEDQFPEYDPGRSTRISGLALRRSSRSGSRASVCCRSRRSRPISG